MWTLRFLFVSLLVDAVIASDAGSATIRVPQDEPTIAAGVAAAMAGDSVVVSCGTYFESGIAMKDGVTVLSETGQPECVTIDGDYDDAGFNCLNLGSGCTIEGMTIRRCLRAIRSDDTYRLIVTRCRLDQNVAPSGEFNGIGGAILTFRSSLEITDCSLVGNIAAGGGHQGDPPLGGGIYCSDSEIEIRRCRFEANEAEYGAGATFARAGTAIIEDCEFVDHEAFYGGSGVGTLSYWTGDLELRRSRFEGNDGVYGSIVSVGGQTGNESVTIEDCEIVENRGYWIVTFGKCVAELRGTLIAGNEDQESCVLGGASSRLDVEGCTIASNFCFSNFCADACVEMLGMVAQNSLRNTIIAFNSPGLAVSCGPGASVDVICSDLFGNEGGDWVGCVATELGTDGNISENPLFCDSPSGVYTLQLNSPCAPPGSGECGLIGSEPVGCETVSVHPMSWGTIKGLYRR